jgi:hypothetical protein
MMRIVTHRHKLTLAGQISADHNISKASRSIAGDHNDADRRRSCPPCLGKVPRIAIGNIVDHPPQILAVGQEQPLVAFAQFAPQEPLSLFTLIDWRLVSVGMPVRHPG